MINILLLITFLTCVGITAAWIAENPGSVTIYWFDYRIDTSFAFLLFIAFISIVTLSYAYAVLRRFALIPDYLIHRKTLKSYKQGITELTYSVAALAAADLKDAAVHTRKAEKLLGRTPLTLLLSAQIARSEGDDAKTQNLLEQMLDYKETEYVAARSLSDSATKQNLPEALALAERAHKINPQGVSKLISLYMRLGHFQQAIQAIEKSARKRGITRNEMQRYKGISYLQQGQEALAAGNIEQAMAAAKYVLKFLPDFSPAIAFCARAYAANKQSKKAFSLLAKHWKASPDSNLADAFLDSIAFEAKDKLLKLTQKLVATNPNARESDILMGRVALQLREWDIARKSLNAAIAKLETVRTCQLMAEVEQGQWSDFDAKGRWLTRSVNALHDPSWVCSSCGGETDHFDAHCPHCKNFDTLKWKQRSLKFIG